MIHATINQFARKTANGVLARRHTVPRALLSGIVTRPLTEDTPKHLEDCLLVQDMLYRVRKLNCVPDEIGAILVDFQVDGIKLGKVFPDIAKVLCAANVGVSHPIFEMKGNTLTLSEQVHPDSRTEAVALVMEKCYSDDLVRGWRDELYPVSDSFYNKPVFLMERSAVNLLGVLEYGVHVNGLIQSSPNEEPMMWIGRRSKDKDTFGGMLDHIVAGGQPAGLGLLENVLKECEEEAGIPEDIARAGLRPAGAISYERWDSRGSKVSRAVIFNFDLYLPPDFVPKPIDGEVEEFFLWTIAQTKAAISADCTDPIKPNCYAVIIDYLIRMGHVSPDVPGYLDVLRELRSGDCR